mmetsp:Transcript_30055/g.92960  ORF Transcript_30055/g.92960 Transcript_30055/m.92960 type:complete len:194 (+) Transcript_30055:6281-6862(+)
MTDLFQKYLPSSLKFLKEHSRAVVPIEDMSLVSGLLEMLDSIIVSDVASDKFKLETTFVFCAIWAFGSALTLSDDGSDNRKIFSDWWKSQFKQVRLPTRDTVFDYWLEPISNKFELWRQSPSFKTVEFDSRTTKMNEVTVPTTETASISHWTRLLVQRRHPVLLAGPSGLLRTVSFQLVAGVLRELSPTEFVN